MIGLLKHKITFKRLVKTPDGRGGYTTQPVDIATVWGAIHPLSASEVVRYNTVLPEVNCKIYVRYRSDINNETLGYRGNKKYQIYKPINPTEADRFMTILAKEVVDKNV